MRLTYPTSFRIVRVPCSGTVDVKHILRALEKGADGVCVIGCMEGECQYKTGNLRARKRVEQVQRLLNAIGVDGERAQMYNLSSSDGPLFAKYAEDMDERIRKLGPNPMKHKTKPAA
ncbi:MAG: hydrogenase iron-sulfur subunit [Desulfobacterales bacterium]|nr:hydrogenase iron-sulfur subunit [Desulfobacterales bacterium]MBS3756303.1 hydrogenase iron-sulfur subunit [Desulfobacterales bacterium]